MLSEIYNKLFENRKLLYLKGVFFRYIYLRLEAGQEPIMLITVNNIIDICIENNKIVIIRGYVDSQNSFSAIVRSNFKIIYNEEKDKYESFIFDGVDYLK